MSAEDARAKWERVYSSRIDDASRCPAVLVDNAHLLPPAGEALDVACGLGGAALFLARRGFRVRAWDIAAKAIAQLSEQAAREGLALRAEVRDVEAEPWPRAAFDVIVVSRFLSRPLCPAFLAALKPGGLLFYQTFIRAKPNPVGPNNPEYLLEENELLELFRPLRLVVYREEARLGNLNLGNRNEAFLVGVKLI